MQSNKFIRARKSSSSGSKCKILLIEDNVADAKLIQIYLKEARFKNEFHHTETFYEGRELAEKIDPDIVLLDLSLPDSSGFKTLTNFLDSFKNIPVIVMTGLNDDIVGNQAIKAGAQDYIVKGEFDGPLLGRVIRYALQRFATQSKLEETARNLAIAERRYVESQEMANFGNFEMDLVNYEMQWTNEMYRIMGFQVGSIQPTLSDYKTYVHFEDRDIVDDFFELAMKNGKRHRLEHRIIVNGHEVKYVQLHCKVYFDNISDKLNLVGGIQDITERKLSERYIEEKNIYTKTSEVKEQVLKDMSFHIRTPLSSIIHLSFLLSKSELYEAEKELMDGLKSSVDDLSISINNLMNFSMLVSQKIEIDESEIRPDDFVQSLNKLVSLKANEKNVNVNFQVDETLPSHLKTDVTKLNQILYNIIDNGIKASSKGQKVDVNLRKGNSTGEKFNLEIEVMDKGEGMNVPKINEILNSDKLLRIDHDNMDKIPLGMAIVNKLLKSLEGSLQIESKPDKGSIFKIIIPVKEVKEFTHFKDDKPNRPLKILLVEDHFLNQISIRKVLTSWSDYVTVDIAENGLVGVEKYREHGYDLVLMDLQMPIMDGFESTSRIRETSQVPIIALTANSNKNEEEKCKNVGMQDYIPKPFQPDDLYLRIMRSLFVEV
ncbi:MAG: response regulator [Saprospiraceae bacterium]